MRRLGVVGTAETGVDLRAGAAGQPAHPAAAAAAAAWPLPLCRAVEDIDQHIAELEHRISHDSLSLNEEKRVMEQVGAASWWGCCCY